jgi:hypothetical protein
MDTRVPDTSHTKHWIKRQDQLASRLYWAAVSGCRPQPGDLAKGLAFVGNYRKQYGEEPRGTKLENICLGLETVLAVSLAGWIGHRDGLHEVALRNLPGMEAKSA